ncbi:hypothetical protein [Flavobacterium sp. GCM10023249]|uniref:hypothetical protein n=1 Tax=unclassified Flavobacterium TaxID=196869 RepID=UPI00361CAD90
MAVYRILNKTFVHFEFTISETNYPTIKKAIGVHQGILRKSSPIQVEGALNDKVEIGVLIPETLAMSFSKNVK